MLYLNPAPPPPPSGDRLGMGGLHTAPYGSVRPRTAPYGLIRHRTVNSTTR